MIVNVIVQARMGSNRLPGKVMMDLGGKPLIGFLIERLRPTMADRLIVAIPERDLEGPLGQYLATLNVLVVGGPEEDVAGRFLKVLDDYPCDAFVRICADSPFMDAGFVDTQIEHVKKASAEAGGSTELFMSVSASMPGTTVEIVGSEIFREAYPHMDTEQREHVTLIFKDNLGLVVDTEKDLERARSMVKLMGEGEMTFSLLDCSERLVRQ